MQVSMKDSVHNYLKNNPRLTAVLLTTLFLLSQATGFVVANSPKAHPGP